PEIAVWRRDARRWLHRSAHAHIAPADLERLRQAGEGPVAVYIQPDRTSPIIEAELYGPLVDIAPGSATVGVENWRIIVAQTPDAAALP
ncbi:MAG: hypothetical protein SFZ24_11270, partial [Planctomycetota bacterium]|nr:hypothetical protein [Planctomycetota bacterium]